jgi:hypothetical protein
MSKIQQYEASKPTLSLLTYVAYPSLRGFDDGGLRLLSHEQMLWMMTTGEAVEPGASVHYS